MTTKLLHEAHTAKPFRPFAINMADGRRMRVKHPEMLAYIPGTRTCAVWKPEAEGWINIDLLLVTALEPLAPPKPKRVGRKL